MSLNSSSKIRPVLDTVDLYFDDILHKYTDNKGNAYTSMTTVIGKYVNEFNSETVAIACERIGKNPKHPKYLRYKGRTKDEILLDWEKQKIEACEKGTIKHDYLEQSIKEANKYNKNKHNFVGNHIYSISDILLNHSYGLVDIDYFISINLHVKYPIIFETINQLSIKGFRFYAEIGVYNCDLLVSGLIDLLAVRYNEDKDINEFIIIDWKTNKANIRFEAGYYEKDDSNNLTNNYILTNKYMKSPLINLPDSVGNHYALQISGYATLVEAFNLSYLGGLLFQIRDTNDNTESIDTIKLPYLKDEVINMFIHHRNQLTISTQNKLFI